MMDTPDFSVRQDLPTRQEAILLPLELHAELLQKLDAFLGQLEYPDEVMLSPEENEVSEQIEEIILVEHLQTIGVLSPGFVL